MQASLDMAGQVWLFNAQTPQPTLLRTHLVNCKAAQAQSYMLTCVASTATLCRFHFSDSMVNSNW